MEKDRTIVASNNHGWPVKPKWRQRKQNFMPMHFHIKIRILCATFNLFASNLQCPSV